MLPYRLVACHEPCSLHGGMGNDEAVEWITCPGQFAGVFDNPGDGVVGHLQADFLAKGMQYAFRAQRDASQFMQVFQFQTHHGRDAQLALFDGLGGRIGKQFYPALEQPAYDVGVEKD